MLILTVSFTIIALFAWPNSALAWGPVTHLVHGATILEGLTTLSSPLQELLAAQGLAYLYGCVGADIVQAKKYASSLRVHCHSWDVGWRLLAQAKADPERAFAYGYLSHLAADVFSHNHFVPLQLIASYKARTLLHAYWEARFDALQERRYRVLLRRVVRRLYPECDLLMERVVERTLFSFRTNKRIFNSVMALQQLDQWQLLLQRVAARSRYPLLKAEARNYNQRCVTAIMSLLERGKKADCVTLDPTGKENLARAALIRKKLRLLQHRGRLDPLTKHKLLDRYLPALTIPSEGSS